MTVWQSDMHILPPTALRGQGSFHVVAAESLRPAAFQCGWGTAVGGGETHSLLSAPEVAHAPLVPFPLVVTRHTDPPRCQGSGKRSSGVPGGFSEVTTEEENKLLRERQQSLPQVLWQRETVSFNLA